MVDTPRAAAVSVSIAVGEGIAVSGLWQRPPSARACLVLAHGAGAGMRHPFMNAIAQELATRDIATLRYQFPYMERASRRPDPPSLCHATVRAAVAEAAALAPTLPRFAGGKSFGGRMTSQAAAQEPLAAVRGLVFLGFPLHPPGNPDDARGQHLERVLLPMLFLQGTRDQFAERRLLRGMIERLTDRATLRLFEGADHSFVVPATHGSSHEQLLASVAAAAADWMGALCEPTR